MGKRDGLPDEEPRRFAALELKVGHGDEQRAEDVRKRGVFDEVGVVHADLLTLADEDAGVDGALLCAHVGPLLDVHQSHCAYGQEHAAARRTRQSRWSQNARSDFVLVQDWVDWIHVGKEEVDAAFGDAVQLKGRRMSRV